jgi:hypothetical protein
LTELKRPAPFSILLGYQRQRGAPDLAESYSIFWHGDISSYYGRRIRVCFAPDDSPTGVLWSAHYVARSVKLLDEAGQEH